MSDLTTLFVAFSAGLLASALAREARKGPPHWVLGMGVASLALAVMFFSFGGSSDSQAIYVVNADGSGQRRLTNSGMYQSKPDWSPDGRRIAFYGSGFGSTGIYLMNADGSGQARLIRKAEVCPRPVWSPDGRKIAFTTHDFDEGSALWVIDADGSGGTVLADDLGWCGRPAWFPDGTKIALTSYSSGGRRLYVINADGSGLTDLTGMLDSAGDPTAKPSWSPDGSRIVFAGSRNYASGIYTAKPDGTGLTLLTNSTGGEEPVWCPDGSNIAFVRWAQGAQICAIKPDGAGLVDLTASSRYEHVGGLIWSPDGTKLAFWAYDGPHPDMYVINADGTGLSRVAKITMWEPPTSDLHFSPSIGYGDWRFMLDPRNWPMILSDSFDSSSSFVIPSMFSWSPDSKQIAYASLPEGASTTSPMEPIVSLMTFLAFGILAPVALVWGIVSWRREGTNPVAIVCVASGAIPTGLGVLMLWVFLATA